ncbi:MAG: PAS domain-containing protein [Oculatellaceae cyanobacterium Prado106]|nr:PAS domain-containing protein [Oculatellaceae cyanobacterium Prado106]
MPSRRDRPTFFDRFSSLPGMLVTAGVIEVGIVILFEQSRYGPWLSHLSLHILTILISTGISLFLTLPRLKREQQVLESVIAERTKALRQVNAQLEQEIEDRKQVEAALRQRETTLKKVQQIAKIGSWEFNLQNRQTIWSEELYRMHGLDPHQPPPTPEEVFMLTHPDDRPIHQQQIVEPVYRGQAFAADIRIVAQDGTLRYVEARGEPILDERLQLIGYIGITHDLTERRITEDKLRQSEATNRALVQSIPDLLIRIHRDATWLDVVYGSNVKLFGLSQSQIERHIQELLPLGSAAELMKTIRQVLHTQQIQVKERSVLFNQKRFYGETRIMPCAEDEVLVIFRDVSDRKQAELELKDAKESAESANRAKSAFISSMSHELRTPLNAIMGFAQLLNRDKSISPQQQHYINTINRSGQHLLELINDVLEVSKIEAGKTVLNTSSFDLYQLLNTLEELFRPKAIAKKLILTIERSRTTPLYIHTLHPH